MGKLTTISFLTWACALVAILSAISVTKANPSKDLPTKVTELNAKAAKARGIIELDSAAFEDVLALPRNYSMVVLFTALSPEFQCAPCK